MRITMKSTVATPGKVFLPGQTYDVADDRAISLVERGHAVAAALPADDATGDLLEREPKRRRKPHKSPDA